MGRVGWGALAAFVWCLMGVAAAFHIPGSGLKSVTIVTPLRQHCFVHKCLPGGSAHRLWVCVQFRPPDCRIHVGPGDALKVHYMVRGLARWTPLCQLCAYLWDQTRVLVRLGRGGWGRAVACLTRL